MHCQKCPELLFVQWRYISLTLVAFAAVGIAKENVPVDFNFRYRIRAERNRTIKEKERREKLHIYIKFLIKFFNYINIKISILYIELEQNVTGQ